MPKRLGSEGPAVIYMKKKLHKRFEKNVPGPFYTTGQCLDCGAPEEQAPDLLAPLSHDNFDTYFVRQPQTPEEIERACRAVEVCCVAALRYGGTDPAIIRRLGNNPDYCDHLLAGGLISTPDWIAAERKAADRTRRKGWRRFLPW